VAAQGQIDVQANAMKPEVLPRDHGELQQQGNNGDTKRTYLRKEFRKLLVGKTPDEVIAAVGGPDSTSQDGDSIKWTYRKRTIDPATGQVDAAIFVHFTDGKVSNVDY